MGWIDSGTSDVDDSSKRKKRPDNSNVLRKGESLGKASGSGGATLE